MMKLDLLSISPQLITSLTRTVLTPELITFPILPKDPIDANRSPGYGQQVAPAQQQQPETPVAENQEQPAGETVQESVFAMVGRFLRRKF